MTPIITPALTPALLAHALGWTLLHFLWQGALIAAVLACILTLLSGRAPQPRYLASCCALVLMTILPAVTFIRILTAPNTAAASTTISIDATSSLSHGQSLPTGPLFDRIAASLDHAMPSILALWSIGVAILLIRLTAGLLIARRMKSATTRPAPEDLLRALRRLARRIGVSRPVQLLNSAIVQVPTVIGWLRPVVLIPFGCLAGLSPTQIEAILAHELAHIRRHDYLISVLQSTIEALLFYHPAVWWVSQNIRREREHCCDDLAVHITGDPLTYARALSLLEERRATPPNLALAINGGNLTMRIQRLLQSQDTQPTTQLTALTLLAVVLIATATCITTAARAQTQTQTRPAQIASQTQRPATNQYQLWIDEDVRWNILPEERTAFLNFTTDQERDHFIVQFWQRRSPAGASPTAAREEHYHRIAYANDFFAAANTPGWQTDRGHIYIVNGAPATINHQPYAEGTPTEIWHYASASSSNDVTFTFMDTCHCGNLQLQSQDAAASQQHSLNAQTAQAPSEPAASAQNRPASITPRPRTSPRPTLRQASFQPLGLQSSATPPAHISSGAMAGNIVTRVNPVYPPDAKTAGIEGAVVLDATISTTGQIDNLQVASGPIELQASAIEAVRQWKYKPYLLNGVPTEVQTTITVNYHFAENAADQPPSSPDSQHIPGGVMSGNILSRVNPIYPPDAKAAGIQGAVLLNATISKTGDVENLTVTSGPEQLRASAIDSVRQWKYKPYLLNGVPTEVKTTIIVNYHLTDNAKPQGQSEPPASGSSTPTSSIPTSSIPDSSALQTSGVIPKKIGNGVSAPVVLSNVSPTYTAKARESKISGKVLINLWVDPQGKPYNVRVVRSLDKGLDDNAIAAVKQYRFKPALQDGKPVTVALNLEVKFEIF
jgi:TonB family protein